VSTIVFSKPREFPHIDEQNWLGRFLASLETHSSRIFVVASLLAVVIALLDWKVFPGISLGVLYTVPLLLAASLLSRWQIAFLAAGCSLMREALNAPNNWGPGYLGRLAGWFFVFAAGGVFVSELNRSRKVVLQRSREIQEQSRLRLEAEQKIRVLIETSPLAILTLDEDGTVQLCNQSAERLLGCQSLTGEDIAAYLPVLVRPLAVRSGPPSLRTKVECRGQRKDGEAFLAHIWFSTYETPEGRRLAAFAWDASENLRDREGAGLSNMMNTSRILIGALSHEVGNLAKSAQPAWESLARIPAVAESREHHALGAIVRALDKISTAGLQVASRRAAPVADLYTVLDETLIVIGPAFEEIDAKIIWNIAPDLPLVRADHHGLLQVFLNLANNSRRALKECDVRQLTVEAAAEGELVKVRFRDSGPGVRYPELLFRPFQPGANSHGLGLYISRATLCSNGGDLRYEPERCGSCFAVELQPADEHA
jgi:two-component system, LuxR family, sensor kinase FixL